jgi:hypothetical protein
VRKLRLGVIPGEHDVLGPSAALSLQPGTGAAQNEEVEQWELKGKPSCVKHVGFPPPGFIAARWLSPSVDWCPFPSVLRRHPSGSFDDGQFHSSLALRRVLGQMSSSPVNCAGPRPIPLTPSTILGHPAIVTSQDEPYGSRTAPQAAVPRTP